MYPEANNPARMKTWIRIMGFCALALAVLSVMAGVFDYAAKRDLREKARWIIDKRNESYDFAILGTSRPYVGIDVATLEARLGGRGINLSIDGAAYPEQYLALVLFLAQNHVRELILSVDTFGFDLSAFTCPHHAYSYLPYIQNPVVFSNLLDNFGWRAYAWKYIPFFKNAEFNSKLGVIQLYTLLKSRFDSRTKETEFDRSGSRLIDRPFSDRALNTFTNRIWSVEALPQRYFLELIEAAKANHLRVTMIMLPEYYPIVERQLNRKEILDFYKSVAASNGVPFIRFDQDDIAHDQSLFFNINHLNRRGAMQFSDRLAQRLAGMQPQEAPP